MGRAVLPGVARAVARVLIEAAFPSACAACDGGLARTPDGAGTLPLCPTCFPQAVDQYGIEADPAAQVARKVPAARQGR